MPSRGESLREGSSGDPRAQAVAAGPWGPMENKPLTLERPLSEQDWTGITGLPPGQMGERIAQGVKPRQMPVPGMQSGIRVLSPEEQATIGQRVGNLPQQYAPGMPGKDTGTRIGQMAVPGKDIGDRIGQVIPGAGQAMGQRIGNAMQPGLSNNPDDRRAQVLLKAVAGNKIDYESKAGKQLAFGAHRIAELWPNLSPGQRSLAISGLNSTAIEHRTGGKPLSEYVVPGSDNAVGGPLKAGHVNDVLRDGQNGYGLARNWNQLSALAAMQGKLDHKNPKQVARLGKAFGMLGSGPSAGATDISGEQLKKTGARPMPEFGIGAMTFGRQEDVPKGYQMVTQTPDKRFVAIPKAHAGTSPLGENHQLAYQRATAVSGGKHPTQRLWGAPPSRGVTRGAVGGSALVSGMSMMMEKNPYLAGSVVAHSLYNNMLGD